MGVDHMDRLHPVTRAAHIGMGAAVGLPQGFDCDKPLLPLAGHSLQLPTLLVTT